MNGKPKFLYSWRLVPTDPQPVGKQPCLSLRELEKTVQQDLDSKLDPMGKKMTVNELIDRYLQTRTGVKPNTLINYKFVKNLMGKEEFGSKKISEVKTSDAKLFLIKLQQDGRGSSSIKTVRGVLRPAFQMAMDDDIIVKNPFAFQLAGVVVNTEHTREAITKDQMRRFLKFVHDDNVYCKYYEVFYILFHTGLRISEFCGLTIKDIDLKNRIINITYCSNQAKSGMNPKTLQYLMGHSDIGVTMNTYTHLGLDDAKNEMIRMEELEQARKEVDKAEGKKPMRQNMFKVV